MISEIKNNVLYVDGCNTIELAEKYGTPLYVYSENAIVKECRKLQECFLNKYENTRAAYAAKAFSCIAMCRIIEREGLCLDVVSGGELFTAIRAGFPAERIEFNGNNKLKEELELAIDYGIGRIIVDGLQELNLIESICRQKNKTMDVLYRITPGVDSHTHNYITTGKKDSKFGIPLDDDVIYPAVEAAINSSYVNFKGIHFHVGSQLFDNKSHLLALETVLQLVKNIKERFNYDVTELNVGGGFGVTYTDEKQKSYEYFLDPIMERIIEFSQKMNIKRPAVVIEPGRSVVAEAGVTLYKVGSIKDIKGIRKYVSVDGGMTDNIRPALYQAAYRGALANKMNEPADHTITVCGKCCESGDILIKDGQFAEAQAGDILVIFTTGAYGYSMASNYNKNPVPAVVLVKDGKSTEIIRRQSYEDIISRESTEELW
ncbi:diaminopimelate decarboxylase [Aminipila luticellarii]|uniref:Diaminopimelate decarboxylase n=1 Tax=Aminipila luticellarii TaxID=2507160 RepID=A0A410PU18_9FIRM|nr:diaminopimelate decarboxylase [Aminipila luticellarii]QAT42447.1 diaminopimelate decarboxylase [Aminipila luticellarii]